MKEGLKGGGAGLFFRVGGSILREGGRVESGGQGRRMERGRKGGK